MRLIILYIIISIFFSCQNRNDKKSPISYNDSLCNVAGKLANEDFQKLKHRLFAERITGFVYDSLLWSEYGIQTYEGTKEDDLTSSCYDVAMASLLSGKYNQNVHLLLYRKSQKIEYMNRTGVSPDNLEVIDLSDSMQGIYLSCFVDLQDKNDSFQKSIGRINKILSKEGYKPIDLGLKLEIDTTGYIAEIHSTKKIDDNIKTLIINELNKNGEVAYFEMEKKRKKFILPLHN